MSNIYLRRVFRVGVERVLGGGPAAAFFRVLVARISTFGEVSDELSKSRFLLGLNSIFDWIVNIEMLTYC